VACFLLLVTRCQPFNIEGSSPEVIFALQNNVASNTPWLTVMYASLNGMGRGDYDIQPGFWLNLIRPTSEGSYRQLLKSSFTIDDITMMYYIGVGLFWIAADKHFKMGRLLCQYSSYPPCGDVSYQGRSQFWEGGSPIGPNTPTQDINLIRARSWLQPILVLWLRPRSEMSDILNSAGRPQASRSEEMEFKHRIVAVWCRKPYTACSFQGDGG